MLHIILVILKIIGIVILILLGIIMFLLLAVLFCPLLYRIKVKRDTGMPDGQVDVSWLAWLVMVRVAYVDKQLQYKIRILGIPVEYYAKLFRILQKMVQPLLNWSKKRRKKQKRIKTEHTVDAKLEEDSILEDKTKVDLNENHTGIDGVKKDSDKEKELEQSTVLHKEPGIWKRILNFLKKISGIPAKIVASIKKLYLTCKTICGKIKQWKRLLTAETTKRALKFLWNRGKRILHHIKPRRIRGRLQFGFDDPSTTGQLLAGFSVLYPVYQQKLIIIPVFDQSMFTCDLEMRGHMIGWVILKAAWDIYRNKDVKVTLRRFQHKEAI